MSWSVTEALLILYLDKNPVGRLEAAGPDLISAGKPDLDFFMLELSNLSGNREKSANLASWSLEGEGVAISMGLGALLIFKGGAHFSLNLSGYLKWNVKSLLDITLRTSRSHVQAIVRKMRVCRAAFSYGFLVVLGVHVCNFLHCLGQDNMIRLTWILDLWNFLAHYYYSCCHILKRPSQAYR